MQPPRSTLALSAALLVAMVAAAADALVVRHAWAAGHERALVVGIVLFTLGAASALAWLWLSAITWLFGRRPLLAALAAAAPLALGLGLAFGRTHLLHVRLGALAPVVPTLVLFACALPIPRLARLPLRLRAPLFGALGLALLAACVALPLRLYAPLRALLLCAAAIALGLALFNGLTISRPLRRSSAAFALGLTVLCVLGAQALLRRSANVRFIAHEQAPLTGLLLDGAALLSPAQSSSNATRAAVHEGRGREELAPALSPLADANLLLITVDALRADRKLPEIDARTADGVRFARAYAQAPHTAFSVSSLLTSIYPEELHPTAESTPKTLADRLRARHWLTAAFYPAGLFFDGRQRLGPYAESHFGFEWADTRTLESPALTDAVLARLAQLRSHGEPRAFVWAHYFDPHEPYVARDGVSPDAPPIARYDSEVAYADREIGRLLAGLKGLGRPTLVVITADHGEEFGEHGGAYHGSSVYEEQVRVPLIFWSTVPGALPAEVLTSPVELVDIAPTVLALLGLPRPASMEGASLVPDIYDLEQAEPRDAHSEVQSRRMLVRGRYKLIHDLHSDVNELYDLEADPRESRNRYDQLPEVAGPMHAALAQWFNLSSPAQLIGTLENPAASPAERAASAHSLGEREIKAAAPALTRALGTSDRTLKAEAALALAALGDRAADAPLNQLLDDPAYRRRAALMLGRLRDPRGGPALLEAIGDEDVDLRRHAIHYLGLLSGEESVAPLEKRALEDLKVRSEAYLALGRIAARTRSEEAARFLVDRLAVEDRADARAQLAWALGLAGAADRTLLGAHGVELLVHAAAGMPPTTNAPAALVRIGAIASGEVGGVRFAPPLLADPVAQPIGLGPCQDQPSEAEPGDGSSCVQSAPVATVSAPIPSGPAVLLLRARALGDALLRERVIFDGVAVGTVELDGAFRELRILLPAARRGPRTRIALEALGARPGAPLAELDHLLVVPAP